MEQLKVKKKDALVLNIIIFLGLSFIFIYLQYAYRHHLSPISIQYFKKSTELFWYIVVPLIISSILIWKHHKFAPYAYLGSIVLVCFKVMEGLFIEFNKIIVIVLFFYSVVAYFLLQLHKYYLSLACLNPNYSVNDLYSPLLKSITVSLIVDKTGQETKASLTNWDSEGCFIKIEEGLLPVKKVKIRIQFQGRTFEQEGEVVARSVVLGGVGIKFGEKEKGLDVFNWSEFYELVHELGYKPERLR